MEGVYINLLSREDRRKNFEIHVKSNAFFSNINRMPGIKSQDGSVGCGLSHIQALQLYQNTEHPYVAIIEDDFTILDKYELSNFINAFEKIKDLDEWKVIVLTPRGVTVPNTNNMTEAGFKRIRENQTTTGYVIKKDMIPILIENIKEAIHLQLLGGDKNICSIDQYWKRLQENYPFYYYSGIFAGQLPGWSDIEGREVNYNDRFLKQQFY